jgi:hypothetical protein
MHLDELRHFCGASHFNDMGLRAQDVAHRLGYTDGGALVQRVNGHPSEKLARAPPEPASRRSCRLRSKRSQQR